MQHWGSQADFILIDRQTFFLQLRTEVFQYRLNPEGRIYDLPYRIK